MGKGGDSSTVPSGILMDVEEECSTVISSISCNSKSGIVKESNFKSYSNLVKKTISSSRSGDTFRVTKEKGRALDTYPYLACRHDNWAGRLEPIRAYEYGLDFFF